ncbi:unnamed protein product [Adineta ricciae]|uniref:Uncharacterized protein n=1 Tax=Adineta ricciae TaxID=249248 RepID=A0A814EVN5_ADIRI|nr:unnamed protein product [Adineta ricciae]
MGFGQSLPSFKLTNLKETEVASLPDTIVRTNNRMVQNVLLVWLDSNIDENAPDWKNSIAQLQRFVNNINTFTDMNTCLEFLQSITDEKICMICSGILGKRMVPRVHSMSQIDSIFIFCHDQEQHDRWIHSWSKIKGVFTNIVSICHAVKDAVHQCERNTMSMSFIAVAQDTSEENLNRLHCSFMYTQILKEILLTMTFEQKHFEQFIAYCKEQFAENQYELVNVNKFQQEYRQQTPIWWYTYECFLYSMLNRALRTMDAAVIVSMGFYIGDLHRQIEELYIQQHNKQHFTLYRGQGMLESDFLHFCQAKRGLMAFNNFLSTSRNRAVSLSFAQKSCSGPEMVGILFVMSIDPTQSTTPFAFIENVGYFGNLEDEVVFSMHTVFRIENIEPVPDERRLFQVNLTLTNENDRELHVLTDLIREEVSGSTGWCAIGELLCKMSQFSKAEEVYQILLGHSVDENEKGYIYDQLAAAKADQGEYQKAINLYETGLKIKQKTLFPNHPHLAASYNNMGSAYLKIGQFSKAFAYYKKALDIQQRSLPTDHPDISMSYSNLGVLYDNMGDYSRALSYYNKSLVIRRQLLPSTHPYLADCYNNIGIVYRNMKQHPKALSFYEKSLTIRRQSLPPNHPDLSASYNNIGELYYEMNDPSKALAYYQTALDIQRQSLSSNHPHLGISNDNIGLAYEKLGDSRTARLYYKYAVDIARSALPSNHPNRRQWEKNLKNIEKNQQ